MLGWCDSESGGKSVGGSDWGLDLDRSLDGSWPAGGKSVGVMGSGRGLGRRLATSIHYFFNKRCDTLTAYGILNTGVKVAGEGVKRGWERPHQFPWRRRRPPTREGR